MSFMARAKGDARRRAVFKWFAALASALPVDVVVRFLPHMLTPLRRCILDAEKRDTGGADEPTATGADVNMTNATASTAGSGDAGAIGPVADLATEVRKRKHHLATGPYTNANGFPMLGRAGGHVECDVLNVLRSTDLARLFFLAWSYKACA